MPTADRSSIRIRARPAWGLEIPPSLLASSPSPSPSVGVHSGPSPQSGIKWALARPMAWAAGSEDCVFPFGAFEPEPEPEPGGGSLGVGFRSGARLGALCLHPQLAVLRSASSSSTPALGGKPSLSAGPYVLRQEVEGNAEPLSRTRDRSEAESWNTPASRRSDVDPASFNLIKKISL
jgi:hypothetical protein